MYPSAAYLRIVFGARPVSFETSIVSMEARRSSGEISGVSIRLINLIEPYRHFCGFNIQMSIQVVTDGTESCDNRVESVSPFSHVRQVPVRRPDTSRTSRLESLHRK